MPSKKVVQNLTTKAGRSRISFRSLTRPERCGISNRPFSYWRKGVAASAVGDIGFQESFSKEDLGASTEYPTQPYPPQSAEFNVDTHIVTLLQDMKEMLERLGNGHALDGLLAH
jgi:hypothetical protein